VLGSVKATNIHPIKAKGTSIRICGLENFEGHFLRFRASLVSLT
jgi:hypothetical protein